MKKKKYIINCLFQLSLIALFLLSCNSNDKETSLNGCWYSFNNDTLYHELCVTDSTFLFFFEDFEFVGPFKYKINNDTLALLYYKDGSWFDRDYKPRLVYIHKNEYLLEYKNELTLYKRIIPISNSLNNIDSDSLYYVYLYEFYKRKMVYLFEAGFPVDTNISEFSIEEYSINIDTSTILDF